MKHYRLFHVCKHQRSLFPRPGSYNRFVELEREAVLPVTCFLKTCLSGDCTGIAFADSASLKVCRNQRIHHHKAFKNIAGRGKSSMGRFFGFKLHPTGNGKGEIIHFVFTPAMLMTVIR
ncbi:hypothetical protein Barb4_01445 [Bacteroidales bacterium Barb4]|nr:hypothetical protein Barb4_01445 [Bacteroidales bacterium Barb4]